MYMMHNEFCWTSGGMLQDANKSAPHFAICPVNRLVCCSPMIFRSTIMMKFRSWVVVVQHYGLVSGTAYPTLITGEGSVNWNSELSLCVTKTGNAGRHLKALKIYIIIIHLPKSHAIANGIVHSS